VQVLGGRRDGRRRHRRKRRQALLALHAPHLAGVAEPGEARSFYAQAVDLNQLLNLNYAFIRNKAKSRLTKLAGSGTRQSE